MAVAARAEHPRGHRVRFANAPGSDDDHSVNRPLVENGAFAFREKACPSGGHVSPDRESRLVLLQRALSTPVGRSCTVRKLTAQGRTCSPSDKRCEHARRTTRVRACPSDHTVRACRRTHDAGMSIGQDGTSVGQGGTSVGQAVRAVPVGSGRCVRGRGVDLGGVATRASALPRGVDACNAKSPRWGRRRRRRLHCEALRKVERCECIHRVEIVDDEPQHRVGRPFLVTIALDGEVAIFGAGNDVVHPRLTRNPSPGGRAARLGSARGGDLSSLFGWSGPAALAWSPQQIYVHSSSVWSGNTRRLLDVSPLRCGACAYFDM